MINILVPVGVTMLLVFLFVIAWMITTFFHEIGHAIPAMVFTKGDVTIFLGSYGDVQKSIRIKLNGRLTFYFRPNLLKWKIGMVRYDNKLPYLKNLVILILGPLFSMIIALLSIWTVYSFDLNGFVKILTIIFFLSALVDLRNIFPSGTQILLHDGGHTYNDGYQIRRILSFKKDIDKLNKGNEFLINEDYYNAIKEYRSISLKFINRDIFRVILNCYNYERDFKGGKEFYEKMNDMPNLGNFDSDTYFDIGNLQSNLDENELALNFYNKSIELDEGNVNALANRAYTYNLFEKFTEALADFDKIIGIDPEFAYAYANRAYTQIKLGKYEQALSDIDKSLSIDENNPYAHRNLGLYNLETGNYKEALMQFQKASDLDANTHLIKEYINLAKEKLEKNAMP